MAARFPLVFPFFFAGIWIGASYLLSRFSGWRALAARYPAAGEPPGERMLWTSAQIGGVSFRSCLNMTVGPAGLYLVPAFMFRLFMPPLLVPWGDVRFTGFKKVFFFEFACLRLGGAEAGVPCVLRRDLEKFLRFLADQDRRDYASGLRFGGSLIDPRLIAVALAAGAAGLVIALTASKR